MLIELVVDTTDGETKLDAKDRQHGEVEGATSYLRLQVEGDSHRQVLERAVEQLRATRRGVDTMQARLQATLDRWPDEGPAWTGSAT